MYIFVVAGPEALKILLTGATNPDVLYDEIKTILEHEQDGIESHKNTGKRLNLSIGYLVEMIEVEWIFTKVKNELT